MVISDEDVILLLKTQIMNNIIYLLPVFVMFSCGGSDASEDQVTEEDSLYKQDHEWIVAAQELKEKLAGVQASFVEIGNKEVEETVCTESSTFPYSGSNDEMNIWLMSTYMLDNFSGEEFGKNNFRMPEALIRNETPLSELNWMNVNGLDSGMFNVYRQYPDLIDIPRKVEDESGMSYSNDEMVQKAGMLLRAIEDGLLGVVVITDYVPPTFTSDTEYESGYVMGYVMFADWENEELSCISPFLAQNNEEIELGNNSDGNVENAMKADLQTQTFNVIDSIARVRTGFSGDVWVNDAAKLNGYKE